MTAECVTSCPLRVTGCCLCFDHICLCMLALVGKQRVHAACVCAADVWSRRVAWFPSLINGPRAAEHIVLLLCLTVSIDTHMQAVRPRTGKVPLWNINRSAAGGVDYEDSGLHLYNCWCDGHVEIHQHWFASVEVYSWITHLKSNILAFVQRFWTGS